MKKVFTITSEVWRWPGVGGWHFVYVDRKYNEMIKKLGKIYGSGFVKIRATIGQTSWDTALFPHRKENAYLISIKSAIRKKEEIQIGDKLKLKVELL